MFAGLVIAACVLPMALGGISIGGVLGTNTKCDRYEENSAKMNMSVDTFCDAVCGECVCAESPLDEPFCRLTCKSIWFQKDTLLCALGISFNLPNPANTLTPFDECANKAGSGFSAHDTCDWVCNCCYHGDIDQCMAACPTAFFPWAYSRVCEIGSANPSGVLATGDKAVEWTEGAVEGAAPAAPAP